MMKKIIIILAFLIVVKAQSNQSIELPNFVITGIRSVDIKVMKKRMPELVSTLSKEFLMSTKSPEGFRLSVLSKISAPDTNVNVVSRDYNGFLTIGAGLNTLPVGSLRYTLSRRHVMLNAALWGSNDREYETNAGENVTGAKVNTDFFVSSGSSFLPGLRIGFDGGFKRREYKFFGSATPALQRQVDNIFVGTRLIHNLGGYNFGIDLGANITEFKNTSLKETNINAKGFLEFNISRFAVTVDAEYKNQSLDNNLSGINSYDYLFGSALAVINLSKHFSLNGGMRYFKTDNENLFIPYASIQLKLGKSIAFYGEFNPELRFDNLTSILRDNKYVQPGMIDNSIEKSPIKFNGTLKYEFKKYFELGAFFNYQQSDNFYYFEDVTTKGFFDIVSVKDTKIFSGGLYGIFHLGPMGKFYGSFKYADAKLSNDNFIPYHAKISADANYSVLTNLGLEVSPKLIFRSGYYSDALNLKEMDTFIDMGINFRYTFFKGFDATLEINNLISNDNYIFDGYKEKPIDIILGIDYRW